jgi:hypothetical protein
LLISVAQIALVLKKHPHDFHLDIPSGFNLGAITAQRTGNGTGVYQPWDVWKPATQLELKLDGNVKRGPLRLWAATPSLGVFLVHAELRFLYSRDLIIKKPKASNVIIAGRIFTKRFPFFHNHTLHQRDTFGVP